MTPIKTARLMRGISQAQLADTLGILPQSLSSYESGVRTPGPKLLPLLADVLGVDEAYLRGNAQHLAVYDWLDKRTISCEIVSETLINDYGIFYLVAIEDVGVVAVISSDGLQLTLSDWQGQQPMTADEIHCFSWVDTAGRPAIMFDGLPRVLLG